MAFLRKPSVGDLFVISYVAIAVGAIRLTDDELAWPFAENVPAGVPGCADGMRIVVDHRSFNLHAPGASGYQPFNTCPKERYSVVLVEDIAVGQVKTARCDGLERSCDVEDFDKTLWDFETRYGLRDLYGEVTLTCIVDDTTKKPKLQEVSNNCRNLLAFSAVNHYSQPTEERTKPLPWENLADFGPWASQELLFYDCGPAPTTIVLKKFPKGLGDMLNAATSSCASDARCKSVGIEKGSGDYYLLDRFHCEFGDFFSDAELKAGTKVRWRGWPEEAPSKEVGDVVRYWNLTLKVDAVIVKFPDLAKVVQVRPSQLEAINEAPWLVIYNLRERAVVCDKLQEARSCNVASQTDAVVLFRDSGKNKAACQLACKAKAQTSRFTAGRDACCVFTGGICALTMGELFAPRPPRPQLLWGTVGLTSFQRPFGIGAEIFDPLKLYPSSYTLDPKEAAGSCRVLPCFVDPLCTFDSRLDFAAPDDVVTSEDDPKNLDPKRLTVYVDFAHPLSMPFYSAANKGGVRLFHVTSADNDMLNLFRSDKGRWVRAVGTVLTATLRDGAMKQKQLAEVAWGDRVPPATLDALRTQLAEVCQQHGARFQRDIREPRITLATRDECLYRHGSVDSPLFEPCLVAQGCAVIDREVRWVPFHGPWFSKLKYDVLAWQQPAPFCCGDPFNDDQRDKALLRQFFKDVDFQDPSKVDLSAVNEEGAKETMRSSLNVGSKAMKKLLVGVVQEQDPGTLNWLAGFVRYAGYSLKKYIWELQDIADSEGDDVAEVSEDGASFLHLHEEGTHIAPSGRRGFPVARWSSERGAFVQIGNPTNSTSVTSKIWEIAKQVPGAIYNYGIKPVWNHIVKPLLKWGLSIAQWVVEHPRATLFISKLALAIRDRMCEKASFSLFEMPETQAVGAFGAMSNKMSKISASFKDTFSPASLLLILQKAMQNTNLMQRMKSFGTAAFGLIMAWAGVATGGAAVALIGSLTELLAEAAIDASKQALEMMVYKEIAKEVPSNLYDFFLKKCLYKREADRKTTLDATVGELKGAATATIQEVTRQVTETSSRLVKAMDGFASFMASDEGVQVLGFTSLVNGTGGEREMRPEM